MTSDIKAKIKSFLDQEFPSNHIAIEYLEDKKSVIRKKVTEKDLRPGQTISGPTLMTLSDTAAYIALLGEGLSHHAVTSHLSINFLRRPNGKKDIIAECELLKIGKTIATGEVKLFSDGEEKIIAHATVSYSLPLS